MLLVLIVVAVLIYGGMYFAWSSFTTADTGRSGAAISVFSKVQDAIFRMPASLPLAIFKVLLMILIVYGIYDLATTTVRRTRLRRDQARRKAELHRTLHGRN